LVNALNDADQVLILKPQSSTWDINALFDQSTLFDSVDDIVKQLSNTSQGHFVVMSNGGFDDIFSKITTNLNSGEGK
jgi:UDP-N-acetylmuramate: L-alanyl-gamma-D-glutamyl-meso-diaminopimelate ligase